MIHVDNPTSNKNNLLDRVTQLNKFAQNPDNLHSKNKSTETKRETNYIIPPKIMKSRAARYQKLLNDLGNRFTNKRNRKRLHSVS